VQQNKAQCFFKFVLSFGFLHRVFHIFVMHHPQTQNPALFLVQSTEKRVQHKIQL